MSTITDTAPKTHDLQVRTNTSGKPLAIRHDGQIWLVDPDTDSQHWYGRDAWWDTRRTAAVGSGDLVSIEFWRVQVRSGTTSDLRTVTLRRDPLSTQWLLENISD
ncbi:hypothetical protein QK292_15815 [Arthrobacter sp. AL08]|uniref:hypothetical protein n=1 Tax=unclassified Arthrobacter TaxID=235627 RepID=UPI00249C6664|nr:MULTISPECIES: hypothetical protein [unclassified Arthrobacter]MDI3243023.1 hypothetical protein [Arthrobacter sp. AL05]MDI3279033.1 hypothetical protein [Arthrobacter sp. AL08]